MNDNATETTTLVGKTLIAMPGMGDSRFHKAVILICAHDQKGAMGLVINHTLPGVDLKTLLSRLHISDSTDGNAKIEGMPVMSGGPVENARGFILHSNDFNQKDTIQINEWIGVTGTLDALRSIAEGNGPDQMIFVLGYAGWGAGQLDREIQDNAWLIFDADPAMVFTVQAEEKWDAAIRAMGIDPAMLSGDAGRA